ncbi:hypothetical protein BK809_0001876, partial [Diplodia seriata]
ASGTLGTALLAALSTHPSLSLTILTRSSSSSSSPHFPPHIPVRTVSPALTLAELTAAFRGHDAVVNALTTAGDELGKRVVDACVAAGVRRLVTGDFGGDTANAEARGLVPVFEAKGRVVEYARGREGEGGEGEGEGGGFAWTAVATGSWIDWTLANGFLKIDVRGRKAKVFDSGTHKFTAVTLANVAHATARTLLLDDPAATANRYLYFQDFACSQRDILAELERQTGEKWTVESVASETEIARARERLAEGDVEAGYDLVAISAVGDAEVPRGTWFEETGLELANDLVGGLPKVTLEDVVKGVLEKAH